MQLFGGSSHDAYRIRLEINFKLRQWSGSRVIKKSKDEFVLVDNKGVFVC